MDEFPADPGRLSLLMRAQPTAEKKRIFLLVFIMATVALTVGGIAIFLLYRAAFDEQRARLLGTARSRARLMEAVARFNARHSDGDVPGGAFAATLTQVREAHARFEGFGETGEFTLAKREGDQIVFLLRHRHADLQDLKPIPLSSQLAEPMRRALSGESGTVVGPDYRGVQVLAAYEPVAVLDLGVVTKIDLAEIRAPFLRAGLAAAALAALVVLAAAMVFFRVSNPVIRRLESHVRDLRKEVEQRKRVEEELRAIRDELENRVAEPAADLEAANRHLLRERKEHRRTDEEKEELQAQLLHSQKMEAVGRLAGGVAHDFNNLMTVVAGYADRLLRKMGESDPSYKGIEEIKKAGERAIVLTRHLLAFGRKQILQPERLDLNAAVMDMMEMLQRLLGEDIDLSAELEPGLGKIMADRVQIDQVIMNLAVNARDAMPQGGALAIRTANVELDDHSHLGYLASSGPHVVIEVRDTGSGMDEEIRERIFEPFFTTKEMGTGTGLGLSTVYGIVRQSGGDVRVYSARGQGTVFKIYVPRCEAPAEEARAPKEGKPAAAGGPLRGSETILLVEDEEALRELAALDLREMGYTVLEAGTVGRALAVADQHEGPIHLLLTDVVLPGLSGRRLFEMLTNRLPHVGVLYMSGHAERHIVHHGVLQAETAFLGKPFTSETLAAKVREVLDASRGAKRLP